MWWCYAAGGVGALAGYRRCSPSLGRRRVPPRWLARRPYRAAVRLLAVVLPFPGPRERVSVLGLALSVDGLLGAWNIVAKGTLGVVISLPLAATTPMRDLILGLQRLAAQTVLTIATLMLRYPDLMVGEAGRMRAARLSRGYDPRFLWQVGASAAGVGALFLRAFERGERVYLAMVSRGFAARCRGRRRARDAVLQWVAGGGDRRRRRPA